VRFDMRSGIERVCMFPSFRLTKYILKFILFAVDGGAPINELDLNLQYCRESKVFLKVL